jgi:hypothetical protein
MANCNYDVVVVGTSFGGVAAALMCFGLCEPKAHVSTFPAAQSL